MGYWRLHLLVILPQALKLVIPGIANTFLALVKDTPLIFVVGLLELVGMLNLAKTNPKWLGFSMEGYVFAGVLAWQRFVSILSVRHAWMRKTNERFKFFIKSASKRTICLWRCWTAS